MREAWRRLETMRRRDDLERGLDEEVRFHVEQQTARNIRNGMTPDEARRSALIAFGGIESTKERTRDEFRPVRLEDLARDVRVAARSLVRAPSFSLVVILTLALGIGASTTVFSVVNGVLLKPLPYPDPDALVSVRQASAGLEGLNMRDSPTSATQYFTYREQNRSFEAFGLWTTDSVTVNGRNGPDLADTIAVTWGTLDALGVPPARGRLFTPEDDQPGSPETVLLTYGYWQRHHGADPAIVGTRLLVDARPRTVIGVMPESFRFLDERADLILPLRIDRATLVLGAFNYFAVARLRPGVSLEAATADIGRLIPIWLRSWPPPPGFKTSVFETGRITPVIRPLKQAVVGDVGTVLWILMAVIGFVLVIACANVANLLLVRAEARQQELAVRAALGAGWVRIVREMLIESTLLGLAGAALGVGFTAGALRVLLLLAPSDLPRVHEIGLDGGVVLFAAGLGIVSAGLFALLPVVKHATPPIARALRSSGRGMSSSRERHRARNTLVVVQVALALALVVASGLMIRSLLVLRGVDPGFSDPAGVQLVHLTFPDTLIEDRVEVIRTEREILDRIAAVPGVDSAAFTSAAPMEPFMSADMTSAEAGATTHREPQPVRRFKFVSPGYFATIRTPVVAGRDFTWDDLDPGKPVVVVSEAVAREEWGSARAALGKRIRENPAGPWREIVGVVHDVRDDGAHVPAPKMVYWPARLNDFWQEPIIVRRSLTYVIRTTRAGTAGLEKDVEHAVWSVNAGVPVAQPERLDAVYRRSMARTSFTVVMLGIAAVLAVLLGIVGVYGVISYAVAQRAREIGIRVALGASRAVVHRMFVGEGMTLAVLGVLFGTIAAYATTRLMASLLFGVSPGDPIPYVAGAVLLVSAAAAASYVPARRSTAGDPAASLRAE
jgi:predicted permease